LRPSARAIFVKWDLDFAIVGETIPEDRFLILHGNEVKADLPLSKLSSARRNMTGLGSETPAAGPLGAVPAIAPIEGPARADRLARTMPTRPGL
jgi:phosphoribosylformylglycinamidine (FGAM) synthase-like enzyme